MAEAKDDLTQLTRSLLQYCPRSRGKKCDRFEPHAKEVLRDLQGLKKDAYLRPIDEKFYQWLQDQLYMQKMDQCVKRLQLFPSAYGAPSHDTIAKVLRPEDAKDRFNTLSDIQEAIGYDYRNFYQDADRLLSQSMCRKLVDDEFSNKEKQVFKDTVKKLRKDLLDIL